MPHSERTLEASPPVQAATPIENRIELDEKAVLSPQIREALSTLDSRLLGALQRGDIRLVSSTWLCAEHSREFRIQRRQVLEKEERSGPLPSPLVPPEEAVRLLQRGDRSVGALTYGWLTPGDPDPSGHRVKAVRRALKHHPHIKAVFWDYASLPQKPREKDDGDRFQRALKVMGDLYASAIGTTVMQLKEVPPRPPEFDGAICLFGLCDGVTETHVMDAMRRFGPLSGDCELMGDMAFVHFTTRTSAIAAIEAGAPEGICKGIDFRYNERSYDGRSGQTGLDDDNGRGWCCFESAISDELIARLTPNMREALSALPPKKMSLVQ